MSWGRSQHRRRSLRLDMTPMIDIVFQLLIFFLTTTQLATLTRTELDLPREQGEQRETKREAGLIVNITATGKIVVSEREIELKTLKTLIEERVRESGTAFLAEVRPLVRADRNAPAARLNEVLSLFERTGVGAARLATSPSP